MASQQKAPVKRGASEKQVQGSTSNAQNIQSKLLGTSVSEINIEKVRAQPILPPYYNMNGKLNINNIKLVSNKFDVGIVFHLDLSNQNLQNLEPLIECQNLMMLNINNNQIKDLFALQNLIELKFLSAAQNQIHSLDYLSQLSKLTNLQIQGNNLKSIKSISGLIECKSLKTLYLQSLSGKIQNPVCELEDYRKIMLQTLPNIYRLDGIQRVFGRFNNGKELNVKQSELKMQIKDDGPWYTYKYGQVEGIQQIKLEGEEKLAKDIIGCKSQLQQIEMRLQLLLL